MKNEANVENHEHVMVKPEYFEVRAPEKRTKEEKQEKKENGEIFPGLKYLQQLNIYELTNNAVNKILFISTFVNITTISTMNYSLTDFGTVDNFIVPTRRTRRNWNFHKSISNSDTSVWLVGRHYT